MDPAPGAAQWISDEPAVERVALDDGSWLDVARHFVPRGDDVHADLLDTVDWQQGRVFRYERYIDSPRLMASCPPGTHPAIDEVSAWLRDHYRLPFSAPALALYRDERDSVAFHRDRELRWLDDTAIAVLTLGARRPWLLRPLTGRRDDRRTWAPPRPWDDSPEGVLDVSPGSGDLHVMGGATQQRWLHAVPKVRARTRPRISVQWRWTSRRGTRDTNPSFYAPRHFSKPSR